MKPVLTVVNYSDELGHNFKQKYIHHIPYDTPVEKAGAFVQNKIAHEENELGMCGGFFKGEVISSKEL